MESPKLEGIASVVVVTSLLLLLLLLLLLPLQLLGLPPLAMHQQQ
jgi:hypothetical protein